MKIELTYEQLNWIREAISNSLEETLTHRPVKPLEKNIVRCIEKVQKDISNSTPQGCYEPHEQSLANKFSALANLCDHIDDQLWEAYDEHVQADHYAGEMNLTERIEDFEHHQRKQAGHEKMMRD